MKFIIIQSSIKLIVITSLIVAVFDVPNIYYTFLKLFICATQLLLIYLMINNKPIDHSVGIAGSGCIMALYNPIFVPNYHHSDWVIVDLFISLSIVVWISVDLKDYFKLKRQLNVKKINLHTSLHQDIQDNGSINLF